MRILIICTGGRSRESGRRHDIPEQFTDSSSLFSQGEDRPALQSLKVGPNEDIRRYLQQQESLRSQADVEEWLRLPEIPDNEEVGFVPEGEIALAPNKVRGKWKSTRRYLKAHFELLREDAISPLRDAVESFKQNPHMTDDRKQSIYEKVRKNSCPFDLRLTEQGSPQGLHLFTLGYCCQN